MVTLKPFPFDEEEKIRLNFSRVKSSRRVAGGRQGTSSVRLNCPGRMALLLPAPGPGRCRFPGSLPAEWRGGVLSGGDPSDSKWAFKIAPFYVLSD